MNELPVLCIGSALWDIIARAHQPVHLGGDVPGRIDWQLGGVALNVALALARTGVNAAILSSVGRDDAGERLIGEITRHGVDCSYLDRSDRPTDTYLAIENFDGHVFGAVADCASLEAAGHDILAPLRDGRLAGPEAPWNGTIVIDGNLTEAVLEALAGHAMFASARLAFVPASPGKAERLRMALTAESGTVYVNKGEAEILCNRTFGHSADASEALVMAGAARAIVTNGADACAVSTRIETVTALPPAVTLRTATGAGDAFLAGHIAAETAGLQGLAALESALEAAARHISRG
jgi:sugar/nucleoside kinase (ribokinase family)